jgi:tetratricopeptide (TPR) repeat protein
MGHHCDSHHLTLEFLTRVREGRLPLSVAFGHLLEHLSNLCPACRLILEQHEALSCPEPMSVSRHRVFAQAAKELVQAKRDLRHLDALPSNDERIATAERSRNRMRSRYLVDLLLDRSQQRILARELTLAIDDCRLAEAISRRIPDERAGAGGSRDLVILVRAHLSNALRVAQRFEAAEAILSPLLVFVQDMVVPTMEAEVLSLAASLRVVQCRFDEALGLLSREIAIYRLLGDNHSEGRALLQLARAQAGRGELRQAIATGRSSLGLIDPGERRDLLAAVHNLAHYLEAAGEVFEAAELLQENTHLYREFLGDFLLQGRLTWLHARLLERQGRSSEAEMAFRQTRRHFLCHDMAYSAAIVTLDLAKLLLDQHRFAEVQALAEESADVLATGALHGYASEAFDLFRQAALAEALSVAELIRIADYLRRAERDPGLRFTGIS